MESTMIPITPERMAANFSRKGEGSSRLMLPGSVIWRKVTQILFQKPPINWVSWKNLKKIKRSPAMKAAPIIKIIRILINTDEPPLFRNNSKR